jgi:hypothetical protein
MKSTIWLAALGALSLGGPAIGQSQSARETAESDATIVVTGEREQPVTQREVTKQAEALSRVGRYQLYDETLPRFAAPVCPEVFGLRDDYGVEIAQRIRANAARLKVKVARRGCSPNLAVVFASDGQELLSKLARSHPEVFCIIDEAEQAEILGEGEPVRVWSYIRVIDIRRTGAPARIFKCREDIPSQGSKVGMFLPERRDIISSMVVFDHEAVLGMTLVQLADYATMRGLSHTRPANGNEALDTILGVFDGDRSSPSELTNFDIGYLESIYDGRPDRRAISQFVGVERRARRADED